MNAADIAEKIAEIEADCKARGIRSAFVCIQVTTFWRHNVRAYVSVMGGKDIEANGDDFEDALVNLREAINDRALTTTHLANVLGIPVEFAAA